MMNILFLAAALANAAPVVVTAPSDDNRSTQVVRYGDLNLAVARDLKRLESRINGAIKDVCGLSDYHAVGTIAARSSYYACSDEAWTNARAEIGAAIALAQGSGAGGIEIGTRAITVSARTSD